MNPTFLEPYKTREPDWGFRDVNGTAVGEIIFLRTYSRKKEDGSKERWWEVCKRVIEGMFTIQKDHCKTNRLPWNDNKAHRAAEDAYERMFTFKWLPPGRGLWMMGTPLVMEGRNSAALQNCAFVSTGSMTKRDPAEPFGFLMEASMYGIGVGFNAYGTDKDFMIYKPLVDEYVGPTYIIPDTREGWVESTKMLLNSYLKPGKVRESFDYSEIRPKGSPIKTFGGVAAGPEPLIELHKKIREIFEGRDGELLTKRDIADIGNLIGKCVVSGNVRRSAELFIGDLWDDEFLNLKNPEAFPERNAPHTGWAFMSNNSVAVNVSMDLSPVVDGILRNGEPGVIWLDTTRNYGRLADPADGRDWRVEGFNPCAEQPLESYECCTLVETFLDRHESLEDYKKTLKVAYLYAKTVTLIPTHWEKTNAIMQRNRRIGTSVSGVANFVDQNGMQTLRTWLDEGYAMVCEYDRIYSEWLCIRESIRKTTVKPSGTVSLLTGSSPGTHWSPGGKFHIRRVTFDESDPQLERLRAAGYKVEKSVYTDGSYVVEFVIESRALRSEQEVSVWEKAMLAGELQRWWSDNSVSVTLSFNAESEASEVSAILRWAPGNLKTVSFLPMDGVYEQMPYENVTQEYVTLYGTDNYVDLEDSYASDALEAIGEAFCTTDRCELPTKGA